MWQFEQFRASNNLKTLLACMLKRIGLGLVKILFIIYVLSSNGTLENMKDLFNKIARRSKCQFGGKIIQWVIYRQH